MRPHDALIAKLFDHMHDRDTVALPEHRLFHSRRGEEAIADLFCFAKSYAKTNYRVFEVKVTASDLTRDYRSTKYEKYLPFCDRFYYVFPKDLIDWKKEIQDPRIGIMTYNEEKDTFHTARAAKPHGKRKPMTEDMALCIAFGKFTNKRQEEIRNLEHERISMLKAEVATLRFGLDGKLREKAEELHRREQRLERLSKDTRTEVIRDIKAALNGEGDQYIWGTNISHILDEVFRVPVETAKKEIQRRLDALHQMEEGDGR